MANKQRLWTCTSQCRDQSISETTEGKSEYDAQVKPDLSLPQDFEKFRDSTRLAINSFMRNPGRLQTSKTSAG